MPTLHYLIDGNHNGVTVKDYVRRELKISMRTLIGLKKADNGILINGKRARSVDVLHTGDFLDMNIYEDGKSYESKNIPIDVVYEDEHFLVVNKPHDMTIYKSGNNDNCLLNAVANYYQEKGTSFVFRPMYRLDKNTSGLVVIAKNVAVASGTVLDKSYYAVCEGITEQDGRIEALIGLSGESKIIRTTGVGKPSVTNYTRVCTDGQNSLVRLKLETGRTHQIRVHMSSIGHSLCGDDLYGGSCDLIKRQALHCKCVNIFNRAVGVNVSVSSDFPEDMVKAFPLLFTEE